MMLITVGAARAHADTPVPVIIETLDLANEKIEVRYRDRIWTLRLAAEAKVTRDGEMVGRKALREGEPATVVYDKAAQVVTEIEMTGAFEGDSQTTATQLLSNAGFEDVTDEANVNHWERQLGRLSSSSAARSGARSLGLRVNAGTTEARTFSSPRLPAKPGGIYRASVWARGKGTLGLNVYQYHASNFMGAEVFSGGPRLQLNDRWQELRCEYRPTDKRLKEAALAIVLSGDGAAALLDDASFTFDPTENPGLTLVEPPPHKDLVVRIETRRADVRLFVAGQRVPIAKGVARVRLAEGLASLGVEATATGYAPGIRVTVDGHPELAGRWRATPQAQPEWNATSFDDRGWPMAAADGEGFLWSADARSKTAVLRQVVLWNETHYGPDRCLLPKVREWGFSRGNFDNLLLALYSPLPFDLDQYEFVLDLPPGFELFGLDGDYYTRHVMNDRPRAVVRERISRNGTPYLRHRIAFAASQVPADGTHYAWLPIRMATDLPGDEAAFFFHRRATGNFTEIEQCLPIRVLPPIDGRQPKEVRISQFLPLYTSALAPGHMEALVAQSAVAGFTDAMLTITSPGWGEEWNRFKAEYYKALRRSRIRTGVTIPGGFPLFATHVEGHQSDRFLRWVEATPAAQARYFDGRPWTAEKNNMFCPSYMSGEGARRYRELVAATYADILGRTPEADTLFVDYEAHAWLSDGEGGKGASFCFCERCKERFRRERGLAHDADLSNQAIDSSLHGQWEDFHTSLVADVQGHVVEAAHDLGLRYMVYSWAGFRPFWSRSGGKADIAFVGAPGNNAASGFVQAGLDDEARLLRRVDGLNMVIGQRFPYLGATVQRGGWASLMVMSDDGFVQAKSWKSQVLRTVATFGGGVDLQNAGECVAGMQYWIGEATRIIATYESFFLHGQRADALVESADIAYPDVLVLRRDDDRLVLLFNDGEEDRTVRIRNRDLAAGKRARVFGEAQDRDAATMKVLVPAGDVVVVEIR